MAAHEILESSMFQAMLSVLANSHPKDQQAFLYRDQIHVTMKLGQIEGYDIFRNNLLSLAEAPPVALPDPPMDWSPPTQTK